MNFYKFFSPSGRIGRRTFWGVSFLNIATILIVAFGVGFAFGITGNYETKEQEDTVTGLIFLLSLPSSWIGIVTSVKRFHDMDRRGWWLLLAFVPFLGGWIVLGWLGIGNGSPGNNKYGAPHLGSPFISEKYARAHLASDWEPPI